MMVTPITINTLPVFELSINVQCVLIFTVLELFSLNICFARIVHVITSSRFIHFYCLIVLQKCVCMCTCVSIHIPHLIDLFYSGQIFELFQFRTIIYSATINIFVCVFWCIHTHTPFYLNLGAKFLDYRKRQFLKIFIPIEHNFSLKSSQKNYFYFCFLKKNDILILKLSLEISKGQESPKQS